MRRFLWVFLAALLFLAALGNFLSKEYHLRRTFNEIRERMILIASNAVLCIDVDEVVNVPLQQRNEDTPEYKALFEKLVKIKQANPSVKYVYIMTATDQPGILQYVADADPLPKIITAKSPTAFSGDKYDARNFSEMINAYNGPSADKKITADAWGIFISGYAPIRDITGKSVAILGVDTDATLVQTMQKSVRVAGVITLSTGFLLLISLITIIFKGSAR